jgi:antitoxin ParD1/3/4
MSKNNYTADRQRPEADELKHDRLRTEIKAGLDALERGAFTEVDDADLDAMLDGLTKFIV